MEIFPLVSVRELGPWLSQKNQLQIVVIPFISPKKFQKKTLKIIIIKSLMLQDSVSNRESSA